MTTAIATVTTDDPWLMTASVGDGRGIDHDEVRRAVALLFDPERPHELRALPFGRTTLATATHVDEALGWLDEHADAAGLYWTLNPLASAPSKAAKDGNVHARRWLLVDVDPIRPAKDCSATDAEKEAARAVAAAVTEGLLAQGWPAPVLIDSGNGFHLLYRIDLPNDALARQLVKAALQALAKSYNTDTATIDVAVHNASRISKLPGTWARKGQDTPERPHRLCRLLSVPEPPEIVSADQLKVLGQADAPPSPPADPDVAWTMHAGTNGDPRAAYARSALNAELVRVALAQPGERNNVLNDAAFRLGTLVGAGVLDAATVSGQLGLAAVRAGLGEHETRATIKSGLEAGIAKPRALPEPKRNGKLVHTATATATAGVDPDEVLVVRASTITPKKVDWLWRLRVPRGFITVFAGRTGLGKSFVTLDMAARVTRGDSWPDSGGECIDPGNVLLISEDPFEYMLAPRLIEMGADLDRINFMTWSAMARYQLADTAMLTRAYEQSGCPALIVIDPPTNFVGGKDEHKNSELRQVLMQVVAWLTERPVACVFITHVNKSGGKGAEAIARVIGGVAWTTTSRAASAFIEDPDDRSRRLFLPLKTNLSEMPRGLAYRIVKTEALARVEWLGESDVTADDAFNREPTRNKPRKENAAEWLTARFAERAEWTSEELFKLGEQAGISRNAIFDAKKLLNLPKPRPVKQDGDVVAWIWRGPQQDGEKPVG